MENTEKRSKRARCTNFSSNEKELLLNLIYMYKNTIGNKKTDSVTNEEKTQAWQKISAEFNASAPNLCHRSTESLKKFYENRKKEIRKQVAEEKKEILLTGGGSAETIFKDPGKELMLSIMNEKTVYGLQNRFGGDSNFLLPSCSKEPSNDVIILELNKENEEPSEDNEVLYEFEEDMEQTKQDAVNISANRIWKKYTPSNLATPISNELKQFENICNETPSKKEKLNTSRRRPTTTVKALTSSMIADKYNKLVDKRIALAIYQEKLLENQLKYQSEEHELKIQLLKLDIELKKQELGRYKL